VIIEISLNPILSRDPQYPLRVPMKCSDALVAKASGLADRNGSGCGAVQYPSAISPDPEIVIALWKHCIDGLVIDNAANHDWKIVKMLSVKSRKPRPSR